MPLAELNHNDKLIVKTMGNMCNLDTTINTEVGALLSHPAHLLEFRYGEDAMHPCVEHSSVSGIFNDTTFRERLMPILEKLVEEKRLYKDPDYLAQPLLLKSQNVTRQSKWARPSKFIGSDNRYVILRDTRPDSILVNDEVVRAGLETFDLRRDLPTRSQPGQSVEEPR